MRCWNGSCWAALCALSALILTGCAGLAPAYQPPPTYQLTVTAPAAGAGTIASRPGGITCPGTCSASFAANTQVTLTETAGANYFFGGWSGSCTGTGACTITLTAAATVSAVFNAGDGLTVALAGTGTGAVTSSSGGINCGTACSASFAPNSQVTLTATPTGGSTFTGWTGGGCSGNGACSVTLASSETITATFAAAVVPNLTLTVTLAGTGTGTVTSSPGGINCGTACSASFAPNTQVTLTATPTGSSIFTGWSGGGCSGTAACSVTLVSSASITATFAPVETLTVTLAGTGTGTVVSTPAGINCTTGTCTYSFPANTQIVLTETPGANSSFTSWSGCTGTTTCTFALTAPLTVTATFSPTNPYAALNHIVLFVQENRSLDHYFGAMMGYWAANGYGTNGQTFNGLPQFNPPVNGITPAPPTNPGCDPTITDECQPNASYPVTSFHFASECQEVQSPFWNEAHNDWDYNNPADQPAETTPPLNGFVFTAAYDARGSLLMDVNGIRAMGYLDWTDLNYYYFMASNFGTSDSWFSPVMDRTQVNRMYLMAATSQGDAYPIGGGVGDNSQLTSTTIFEALQNAGISWKIYVNPEGVIDQKTGAECNNDISDANSLCLIQSSYINMFAYENTIINSAGQNPDLLLHIAPISQFAIDAQSESTFPQFALIEPASAASLDEHPNDIDSSSPVDVQAGANYAAGLINAFMLSPV